MASFDAEFFMDSLDPEDKFNLRYQDDLPFPDPKSSNLSQEEIEFENFFQDMDVLYWDLTSGMHRLHKFGMNPTQEDLIDLTRYILIKLRSAYRDHPLYRREE